MAHGWSAAGYKKTRLSGFGSNVTCCILAEGEKKKKKSAGGESVSALLSPAASSLPPLCFLLCRRASSNDLPLLCRAPSAWPWAEAICRLFVPVTSAPMGTGDYFSSLFWASECESAAFVGFIMCGGVLSQGKHWEEHLHANIFFLSGEYQVWLKLFFEGRYWSFHMN